MRLLVKPGRICIIGLGLIGGSIGMALLQREKEVEVIGVAPREATLEAAVRHEAVHRGTSDPVEGVKGAHLVILATPPGQMGPVASAVGPYLDSGSVVTDVASLKQAVVRAVEPALPAGVAFLGGHPMAGSERAGIGAADPYLFENAVWALTPTDRTTPRAMEWVNWLVGCAGAHLVVLSPEEHDLAVAAASHLPHVAAMALVHTLNRYQPAVKLAGRGFRDTTRVAGGHPRLWRDILLNNRQQVLEVLSWFRQDLDSFMAALSEANAQAVEEGLAQGKEGRAHLPSGLRAYLPFMEEIVITIPDRPGSLALVTDLVGKAGINIADIEIMGVRDGEGGSVRLGFASEQEARQSLAILEAAGIKGRRRQ